MRCHLADIARRTMLEKGLKPDFSQEALDEANAIQAPIAPKFGDAEDLTRLQWCSIDNDDSRDLDQLTYAEGNTVYVAIADVTESINKNDPIDRHAAYNTTSVYTPDTIFTMIPERLCYDITSLNPDEKRLAVVVKMALDEDADVTDYEIKLAWVYNKAKLTYNHVGPMLEGKTPFKPKEFEATLRLQNALAQKIKAKRIKMGALTLDTAETKAIVKDDQVLRLEAQIKNKAHELIENFMIITNTTIAKHLKKNGYPSLRRVVREPERWDRIVNIAREKGANLPSKPDSRALDAFLRDQQKKDPLTFPDLSLTIIKLLGSGEYLVELPEEEPLGHFGLAISEYAHTTAPNRRYPDIVTQNQLKALLFNRQNPYSLDELYSIAKNCTDKEDQAQRVERHLKKSAAACLLHDKIGSEFKGIITGASFKGTWVRIFDPPVEGKIVQNMRHLDVGDKVNVRLLSVDIELGHIDFVKI
ncbi:MAG: RNB domain-containing ribonuclease [Parachlamydiaceae bacterium]